MQINTNTYQMRLWKGMYAIKGRNDGLNSLSICTI